MRHCPARLLAGLILTIAAAAAPGGPAAGQQLTLRLQTAFPDDLPVFAESLDRFAMLVRELSGGEIVVEIQPADADHPPFAILDNVGAGTIDAGWSFAGYWTAALPAAVLFGGFPFGPDPADYLAWIHEGGGLALWRELYAGRQVVPVPCGVTVAEAAGWFRREITAPEDLAGLSIRIGGLGAEVLSRVGAAPVSLPASEVGAALTEGRIDAAKLSFPAVDTAAGLAAVAPYYYFPGWHQPGGLIELLVNAGVWEGMTDRQRLLLGTVCRSLEAWTLAQGAVLQHAALAELAAAGVELRHLPEDVVQALREAADAVLAEHSAADPMFDWVLDSYRAFRDAADAHRAAPTAVPE